MIDRLADDHENARLLARGLSEMEGVRLEPPEVETNLVYLSLDGLNLERFQQRLWDEGVLSLVEDGRMRMVTHYGIEREDIGQALERARRVAGRLV
ncbi:MAG: hypothetical protein ACE5KW_05090 [Dehalococcoidia bacterium]